MNNIQISSYEIGYIVRALKASPPATEYERDAERLLKEKLRYLQKKMREQTQQGVKDGNQFRKATSK